MNKIILLIIFFCNNIFAQVECEQKVKYLKYEEKSPCNGYLFSPDAEKEVRKSKEDLIYYQELTGKQDELNSLLQNKIVNLNEQVKTIEKQSKISNYLFFGLGATFVCILARCL